MNFLELVQRLHSEAGIQGTAPATVIGQTGMNLRVVNWTLTAYEEIQGLHETWLFRQEDFSFPTIMAIQNYTPVGVGLTDLSRWKIEPDGSGIRIYSAVSDEADLSYYPWEQFRATYKFGSSRTQSGRPSVFSIKPDTSMDLWPIPDAVYTVNGEYVKQVQTMTANDDEPVIPDYHMIIVWRGLMYYGAFEGASDAYSHGQVEYKKLLARLMLNQLPTMTWGDPLA